VRELQGKITGKDESAWDFFDVMNLSIETMQNTITRMKLAAYNPDVTVNISRDAAHAHEFYRAAELIELGSAAAAEMLARHAPGAGSGSRNRREGRGKKPAG
jgi:predicted acylesterase/phospholipase RssA